jgi:hypothetical protein
MVSARMERGKTKGKKEKKAARATPWLRCCHALKNLFVKYLILKNNSRRSLSFIYIKKGPKDNLTQRLELIYYSNC